MMDMAFRSNLKVLGDYPLAALLTQIQYWTTPDQEGQSKLRVKRDGLFWIAKTREEWMEECTLSLDQYRRAISLLKKHDLVEVKMMKFRGITMSHLRAKVAPKEMCPLLTKKLEETKNPHSTEVKSPTGSWGNPPHPSEGFSPSLYIHITTTNDYYKSLPTGVTLSANANWTFKTEKTEREKKEEEKKEEEKKEEGKKEEEKKEGKFIEQVVKEETGNFFPNDQEGETMDAAETLAKFAENKKKIKEEGKVKQPLPILWKSKVAEYTGFFHQSLTHKEVAQLKRLGKLLGEQVEPVIAHTIENWKTFGSYAKSQAGLQTYPKSPHIGFFLAHHAAAWELYLEFQSIGKNKEKQSQSLEPVFKAKPVPTLPKEIPYIPSDEEFAKDMAKYYAIGTSPKE